jgi:hypothetical protein
MLGACRAGVLGLGLGPLSLVLLVLLAVALHRGGEREPLSPSEYRQELSEAVTQSHLDAVPTDRPGLRRSSDQFQALVDELTDFTPPPEVAVVHTRFVAGLDEYATLLERLAEPERGGAVELHQQLAELGGLDQYEWVKAMNELAAAGYLLPETQ